MARTPSHCWKPLPIAFGFITIPQNPFPLNLPFSCDGKGFWRIENAGNIGKRSLKTTSHRKKCTKTPQNSLKPCLKHGKVASKSLSHVWPLFRGFGGLYYAKLRWNRPKTKKAHISVWPNARKRCFDKLVLMWRSSTQRPPFKLVDKCLSIS